VNGDTSMTGRDVPMPAPMTMDVRLSVNGDQYPITVDTRETLLDTLREQL
jgi:xanthine dehydrogenase YagT iron-sulfur-binding subunit